MNTKSSRFKSLRIALTAIFVCFLALSVASIVFPMYCETGKYGIGLTTGTFVMVSYTMHDIGLDGVTAKGGSMWWFDLPRLPVSFALWPHYSSDFRDDGQESWCLIIPLWLPLLPLLAFAALLVYRDRTRRALGHCAKCGYNLQGNTSGRCPECGAPIQMMPPNSRAAEPETTK